MPSRFYSRWGNVWVTGRDIPIDDITVVPTYIGHVQATIEFQNIQPAQHSTLDELVLVLDPIKALELAEQLKKNAMETLKQEDSIGREEHGQVQTAEA